ncbi:MAG: hypothetical protein JWN56_995 [Sphingobacteriales bacterium]|nr:hypothetical protein [Sphingobacteriales bacterium]
MEKIRNANNQKISICTVCMNRLHHLKLTLMKNILDNVDYPELEFILLDYNSSDGLEDYINKNFHEYIKSGKLIYYRTTNPQYFNRSHSRNVVFKLATGAIICNVDADNYTGKGFAAYVNKQFINNDTIFLSPISKRGGKKDVLGRICVKKADFDELKGYDERLVNYGFEDNDFVNRLQFSGLRNIQIKEEYFLQAIPHDDKQRLSNEYVSLHLHSLLFNYLTPSSTDCVLLFNDNTFKRGTMIENKFFNHNIPLDHRESSQLYEFSVLNDDWVGGRWSPKGSSIRLQSFDQIEQLTYCDDTDCFISITKRKSSFFFKISTPELIQQTIMFFSQTGNRIIMERNKMEMATIVNAFYGRDTVCRNFINQTLIAV